MEVSIPAGITKPHSSQGCGTQATQPGMRKRKWFSWSSSQNPRAQEWAGEVSEDAREILSRAWPPPVTGTGWNLFADAGMALGTGVSEFGPCKHQLGFNLTP